MVAFSETKGLKKESLLLSYVKLQAHRQDGISDFEVGEFICLTLMTFKDVLGTFEVTVYIPVPSKGKRKKSVFKDTIQELQTDNLCSRASGQNLVTCSCLTAREA